MASNQKQRERKVASANRKANRLASFVQTNIDKLYQSIYYTQPSNKHDLDTIKSKLDASIDGIVSSNKAQTGQGNLSALYNRAMRQQANNPEAIKMRDMNKDLESLLNDTNILDTGVLGFMNDTTTVADYDAKIDTIVKYMPKLKEALDTRKDNVLSADHFSKDFINVTNTTVAGVQASVQEHIKEIKERYNFIDIAGEIYDNASKYGEQFVYIVPAKKAIAKLLANKNKPNIRGDIDIHEHCIISESGDFSRDKFEADMKSYGLKQEDFGDMDKVELEFNCSGLLTETVENEYRYYTKIGAINEMALSDPVGQVINEATEKKVTDPEADRIKNAPEISNFDTGKKAKSNNKTKFDDTVKDDLKFDNFDYRGTEGLITGQKHSDKGNVVDIPGSIVKLLDREHIIPIYIETHCFGYYYIETDYRYDPMRDYDRMQDPTMSLKGSNSILSTNSVTDATGRQNNITRFLSSQIAQYIDANFVNSNQDLRDEIYMILKNNDMENGHKLSKVKVTFIPPEDMEHVYFRMNKKTHRGISDLHEALFPATLYSAMYITNCIMTMTRSQDKRVYYVKQNVDTNISKTLLNTINQIKKGNMNIRQIENINHILNITGRFNDYIVPRNSSGESPIDFEVMQGQQVEFKTELMTVLEEMAINSTDVPLEMIQMRQSVEYATQLTMTSSKFLRKVYNRQAKYQKNLTRIFSKLYKNEYQDDDVCLEVTLPPPMFLNITNTNQMVTNVQDYANSIAEIELAEEDDEMIKRLAVKALTLHFLGSYLDLPAIEEVITRAKQEASKLKNKEEE